MTTASPLDGVDRLVVGGYTAEMGGTAPGLVMLTPTAAGTSVETSSVAPARSPSYVIADPSRPWLLVAGEGSPATVSSYRLDDTGRLDQISHLPTGGDHACHLALSDDHRHLLTANYGSGSVSSFAVGDDGTLTGPLDVLEFAGSGPDADRQDRPHAHQVLPVDGEVLVCDLGTDRVHRLRLDTSGRFARAADPIHLPPGAGPRHAVIVEDRLIVACELSSELWVARREGGGPDHGWIETQRLSTTEASAVTRLPSGIVSDGRTVVVATRGPDTITTFGVHEGRLTRLAEVPSGGAWPRALTLHGRWLWVANQDGGSLTVLDLSDPRAPVLVNEFAAPSATCIAVLPPGERR